MVDPAAPTIPPPDPASSSSASAPAPAITDEIVEDGSASYAHVLWQCMMKGKLDFLELFAGSARLSQCAALRGLRTGSPVDLRTGFDLNTRQGQAKAMACILEQKPEIVHMAPLCSPWCLLSNLKGEEAKAADRKAAMPMVRFCATVALHQIKNNRKFIIENPKDSSIWYVHCFQDLLRQKGVDYGTLNFCAFGMRDPVSGKYYKKGTSLLHNFPAGTLDPIFKLCPNTVGRKVHEHETCEGHAKGHGSRTKLSQIYPYKFCEQLSDIMGIHLGAKVLNVDSLLINDILDASLSDSELGSVHRHFSEALYTESLAPCQVTPEHETSLSHGNLLSTMLSPLPVKTYATKQLMTAVNSLAKGKELLLHLEGYDTMTAKLTSLAQQARQKYLPLLSFSKCSVLRGNLGTTAPIGIGDESYLLFWRKNDSPKWIFLIQVQQHAELLHQFDPSEWSFVHFWKEAGTHSNKQIEPPPGLQQKPQLDPTRPSQLPLSVESAVPKLLLDNQVPGGHQLIPPQDDLMDHELEGEDLPPP